MKNSKIVNNMFKFENIELLAHPPLSAESLTGRGFRFFQRLILGGKTNCHPELYKAKAAFTLAEVLITLVIIGVIAALTIPNLMQKYTEQTTVKKLQKFYSNLSNAYSLAMKENGSASEWGITGENQESAEKIYKNLIQPYFKIAKNCGVNNTGNCLKAPYLKLNNTAHNAGYEGRNYYKVVLDDGATFFWRGYEETHSYAIAIYYDINGTKKPNQWGKDLFSFGITKKDKVLPMEINSSNCNMAYAGFSCAAWVIYKGNMDYLHCDDLSWTGKSKCK